MQTNSPLSESEIAYLGFQRLGRLATVSREGVLQNNPVGFFLNEDEGTVDIYGFNLGATHKFRNVKRNPHVSLVVDDLASVDPWVVRGVEIRGLAEARDDGSPPMSSMSGEVIRIHPTRVISWGVDPENPGVVGREVDGYLRGVEVA